MKKYILVTLLVTLGISAEYSSTISKINKTIKSRMIKGDSWRKGCPVSLQNLRYLQVSYWDFRGKSMQGELIVHKDVSQNMVSIFKSLYAIKYPIQKMRLVSDYKSNDWQSIEAGNTSAFNCRPVTGNKKKWSKHAYGRAIDINPIQNPYISRSGHISHKASLVYRHRKHKSKSVGDRAMLLNNDKATQIFKKNAWSWGGDWKTIKDYQHFKK